jgi:transposase
LHQAGYALSIIQPARARAHAYSHGILAKTDVLDAKVLRLWGEQVRPFPALAPSAEQRRLQELALRRSQLVEAKTMLTNQAEHYEDPWTQRQARTQLRQLEGFIAKCEEQIAQLLAADEQRATRVARMQEVPGVGPITAAMMEAYLPELGGLRSTTAAALAGLAPCPDDSGPRNGPRFIRGGRKPVRCALFMAAMSTIKHDAIFKAFYTRLRAAGKKPMVALTAVMRKLVVLLNRLLADPSFTLKANAS